MLPNKLPAASIIEPQGDHNLFSTLTFIETQVAHMASINNPIRHFSS
jgi:hypothetical protein